MISITKKKATCYSVGDYEKKVIEEMAWKIYQETGVFSKSKGLCKLVRAGAEKILDKKPETE